MTKIQTYLVSAAIFVTCACGATPEDTNRAEQTAQSVTVYRDDMGVAHVHGPTDAAAAFGFAYAQAEDNFWQIEDNFIRAIGRAAEVHGEAALPDDWTNRALEIPTLSEDEYQQSAPHLQALLDGFADGLNHYVATHPEVETRLLDRFEPWYPLAFIRYLYYQSGFLGATRLPREAVAAEYQRSTGLPPPSQAWLAPELSPRSELGSNSWAVTPEKSASGNALLLINPHLPFFGPSQVYEGHVMSNEGWNFTGYTRFGFPLPYVGHNEKLGWASTDNAADLQDVYIETFDDPESQLSYRYGDERREAFQWADTLKVKTDSGIEERTANFRKTHHGPILAIQDGKPLSVRMAKFEEPGWLEQWYQMSRAQNLDEFVIAVSALDMLFGNYLYADGEGNIYYVYNAAVPKRDPKFDWTAPVDGSDPATEWQGYHPMDEIPQLLNPETGWLQNCNGTPFLSTSSGNPVPEDFPPYMVREGDNPRHRQARRLLTRREKFTFDEWAGDAYSTECGEAEEHIAQIVEQWENLRAENPSRAEKLSEAISFLREWDRVSTVQSEEMTLYVAWGGERFRLSREGDDDEYLELSALESAMAMIQTDWESWRVPWGEVNRLLRTHTSGEEPFSDEMPSLPIAGAPGFAGAMFTFYARASEGNKRRYGTAGNTYVAVVEFGPEARARTLHTFGANADPNSPHYFDQAPRYAEGDFKRAWLTLSDVQENATRSYHPGHAGR